MPSTVPDFQWGMSATESPLAGVLQQQCLYSCRLDRPLGSIDIRDCCFGIKSAKSASNLTRAVWDHERRFIGDIERDLRTRAYGSNLGDSLAEYCAMALTDGTTFEIARSKTSAHVFRCFANATPLCQIEELPTSRPIAKNIVQRVKELFNKQRQWIVDSDHRIGSIDLQYPIGGKRRQIEFQTDHGSLPVQVMKPRYREGVPDTIIPHGTPRIPDPAIVVIHFLLNVAFR